VESPTLPELVDVYLAQHEGEPETTEKLRWLLAKAVRVFGERSLTQLRPPRLDSSCRPDGRPQERRRHVLDIGSDGAGSHPINASQRSGGPHSARRPALYRHSGACLLPGGIHRKAPGMRGAEPAETRCRTCQWAGLGHEPENRSVTGRSWHRRRVIYRALEEMARAGIEPATPRFSVSQWKPSNSRDIPGNQGVLRATPIGPDMCKVRVLCVDSGHQMQSVGQSAPHLRCAVARGEAREIPSQAAGSCAA
jgi:hypothetical protein